MTPDEVRMLDNRYAILFIRGERPIIDEKYNLLEHPNIALSAAGDGRPYYHGRVTQAIGQMSLIQAGEEGIKETEDTAYLKLNKEQIEKILNS